MQRKVIKGKPFVLWFTGLSGSGKTTIARIIAQKLIARGVSTQLLDGDDVRQSLCSDLGYSKRDRQENMRRVGEINKLLFANRITVINAFISPFSEDRNNIRKLFLGNEFIEVFVDTHIELCEKRDSKGLYQKARSGKLQNFTGIDSKYEAPKKAEIHLFNSAQSTSYTESLTAEESAEIVWQYLIENQYIEKRIIQSVQCLE